MSQSIHANLQQQRQKLVGVILEDMDVPQQVGSLYANAAVVPSFTAPVDPTARRMPVTIAMGSGRKVLYCA